MDRKRRTDRRRFGVRKPSGFGVADLELGDSGIKISGSFAKTRSSTRSISVEVIYKEAAKGSGSRDRVIIRSLQPAVGVRERLLRRHTARFLIERPVGVSVEDAIAALNRRTHHIYHFTKVTVATASADLPGNPSGPGPGPRPPRPPKKK